MRLIGIALLFFGSALYIYALNMDAYHDEELYMEKYLAIDREALGRDASLEQFYELRSSQLTKKFKTQDYSITIFSVGIVFSILFWKGLKAARAPNTRLWVAILGVVAALVTVMAYVGDLFLEYERGSFPHWADSLGIPLLGVPMMLVLLIGWASLNMLGMKGNFSVGQKLLIANLKGANIWYLILSIVTFLILSVVVFDGFFWLVIPGTLWLYFYLSILAGRFAANKNSNQSVGCAAD